MKKKVVIGMSGGVDSSVAAWLLKQQGYEVWGVTMQVWQDNNLCQINHNNDCWKSKAVEDARKVALQLDIPYSVMDFQKEFREKVIQNFMDEYLHGRTPNPCIICNRYIKWEALLERSFDLGADYIATGHYAQIEQLSNGRYTLKKSVSAAKDQTYALYRLTQEQLSHTLMPVGAYTKEQIRKIAVDIGLSVAQNPDSQEICFIPDKDYARFIEENAHISVPEGNFVYTDGTVVGRHRGITHYTIGQRKGLNLSLGRPVFVLAIRPESNEVVVGDEEEVFSRVLRANHLNWMGIPDLDNTAYFQAKIRYHHAGAGCVVRRVGEDEVECIFDEPVRAVTPGQAVVFYQDGYVMGGGTILSDGR